MPAPVLLQLDALGAQALEVSAWRAAVVGREEHESILRDAGTVDRLEHLPHRPVRLEQQVGIRRDAALAPERLAGRNRRVRTRHREEQEERLPRLRPLLDVAHAAPRDLGQDALEAPTLDADAVVRQVVLREGEPRIRLSEDPRVLDPREWRPVGHVIAEVVVEARLERPGAESARLKGAVPVDLNEFLRVPPAPLRPTPAEVPLADARRVVATSPEHRREGLPPSLDERPLPLPDDAGLQATPPRVAPRQQRVACR